MRLISSQGEMRLAACPDMPPMYAFPGRAGIVPEGTNPARGIHKFEESRRERFLTREELNRFGIAIQEGETGGIPWTVDESRPPSTSQRPSVSRKSPGLQRRRFGCLFSLAAVFGKFCTRVGSISVSNVAVCSCPTAKAAAKQSSSTRLPSQCSMQWSGSALKRQRKRATPSSCVPAQPAIWLHRLCVLPGSLKKREALVVNGITAEGRKTTACTVCHGGDLRGLSPVPAS
jgi:hypothetical protein